MKSTSLLAAAVIIFLSLSSPSYSQVQIQRQTSVSNACGGYFEYLPQGYNTNTSKNYPLIIAVHGLGELGNGTTDLANLLNCWTAIPRLIENGGFPSSFTVGGQSFGFIVISPQFKWWPSGSDVNDVVDYAIRNYRVDQSRIYVTGLSMGGGAVWDFAGNFPTKAAAIVPVCGAAGADGTRAQAIASAKLPVWATHNQEDPIVSTSNTTGWINLLTQYGGSIQSTIFPISGHDAWTKTYDPNFTQNGLNVYQWMLMHQKGNSTPVINQPPVANAGADQILTLPQNSIALSGTGTDPDGTISFYEWSQLSGPSPANITSVYTANTTVNNLVEGAYIFTLKVTDNKGATATSNVTIRVNGQAPVVNQPPVANAGTSQTVTLPVNSVTLSGSGSDPDGTINFYEWTQSSGPSQAAIASPYSATTGVINLLEGTYVFTLKVTDNKGATATSNISVKVNAASVAPNQKPSANAGTNQTITLPTNSATVSGSGSDPDGSISFYEWKQTSGPSRANIASPYSASTAVNNLVEGIYVFTLKVTDNNLAIDTSNVTITVNASLTSNQPPSANAGNNQSITLPLNSVNLSGSGSDPDGTISSYEWSQISGPAQANFASANSASTVVNNLIEGSYVFTLKVTDNKGATATSNMTVTVNAVQTLPNQPPIANAGVNQVITLPVNSVTLSGSGSDPDGTISFYEWTQSSGPSQAGIASPYSAITGVINLLEGTYVFTLKVSDNKGATATSNVTVKVNAATNISNQSPSANAGIDQAITLPQNSVSLNGTASDPDGSVVTNQWTQISGPSQANITSPLSSTTTANNLIEGTYIFKFTVQDNEGATASDEVLITVNEAPNKSPVAKAGSDQTITLPLNSVILRGSGLDSDGTVSAYQWIQISGPSKSTISSPASASTTVDSLKQGVYLLRLTVTDNKGLTGWDDVTITVNRPPNQAPVTNAGPDQIITLPTSSVDLLGAVSDSDGTIVSYQWTQISGPSKTNFSSASPLAITVDKLVEGVYYFRLTASDNDGATTWDDIKVTVLPDPRRQSTAMLFPNPATNMINVRIDAVTLQNNTIIRISNSAGDVVYTESFMRSAFRALKQIDISKLPNGVYFLTVTADINTYTTLTFIKQ